MVTRRDLLTQDHPRDVPVAAVTSADLVSIGPDASLVDAMQVMAAEDVTHIPVIDGGVIVGICTRADIVRSRSDELALERLEPGWLAPVVQRRNRVGRRILVVGNESLGGRALMTELQRRAASDPNVRFHILVPLAAGGDLTAARERLETQLGQLAELGFEARGEIAGSDPLTAIETALRREPATAIILSTLPPGRSRWLRSDVPTGITRRVDLPCIVVHDDDNPAA
jgi:hypothetical protein